jgi:hypothetical protein
MVELSVAGKHLGLRVREVAAALERLDSFVFDGRTAGADAAPAPGTGEIAEAFVLRALRAGCEPEGWRCLDALRHEDATTASLAGRLGIPRVVAWEQVNALVQVGLVARDLAGDRIGLTPAGRVLLEIVAGLATAAGAELAP